MRRLVTTLFAIAVATPVYAQNIQEAANGSMVLDNTAKGIVNDSVLLQAIPGASALPLPIQSTGYFAGGIQTNPDNDPPQESDGLYQGASLGSLGIGGGRNCPFVNGYRAETTYMPGQAFRVRNCGLINNFWVGVRVYGMICSNPESPANCQHLKDALSNPEQYETDGYFALLKPGPECGPAKWLTEDLRRAGAPAYAEWCDFGIRVP